MSVVTMLAPDLDHQVGMVGDAVEQMMAITRELEAFGTLPAPFVKVTPNVYGHGEAFYHPPTGLWLVRADHRPILLLTNRCATCGTVHTDVCHMYVFMSPADWQARAYLRYTGVPLELGLEGEAVES